MPLRSNDEKELRNSENRSLLLIDTDAGIDDALAILVALREYRGHVVALTSVYGNASSEQVASNLRRIVAIHRAAEAEAKAVATLPGNEEGRKCFREEAPFPTVYRGAAQPLLSPQRPPSWEGHGPNGLGGTECEDYAMPLLAPVAEDGEHAANAMIRLAGEHPRRIDAVALGPLTNLALAAKLDPDFFSRLRSLHVMGGTMSGKGNASMAAEFNFHSDPEAAKIVLSAAPAAGIPVAVVPWEAAEAAGAAWERFGRLTSFGTHRSRFLKSVCAGGFEKICRNLNLPFVMCDVLPMAALIFPELVEDQVQVFVDVETSGGHGRGMLAVDWYGRHCGDNPKISLIRRIASDTLWQLVERVLKA